MDDLVDRQEEMKRRNLQKLADPRLQEESRIKGLKTKDYLERKKKESLNHFFLLNDADSDAKRCSEQLEYVVIEPKMARCRGVYVYYNRGLPLYVGMTIAGIARCSAHLTGEHSVLIQNSQLWLFRVPDWIRVELIEAYLIIRLEPILNKMIPTQTIQKMTDEEKCFAAKVFLYTRPGGGKWKDKK